MTIRDKITPGAWDVYDDIPCTSVYCDDTLGSRIADCTGDFTLLPFAQRSANAKAISKVPEMLEIIQELKAYRDNYSAPTPLMEEITDKAVTLWEQLNKEQ